MLDLRKYEDWIQKCSRCKFCQATCPVFLEELLETYTAGARINLIYACLAKGEFPTSERFREVLDRCLLCTSCVQGCPPNIPVDEIVVIARHNLYQGKRRDVMRRNVLRGFMERRGFGSILAKAGAVISELGLFPSDFPAPAEKPFSELCRGIVPAEGKTRAKVAYFVGCATNAFYPDTAEDVVRVMSVNGIEVIIPEGIVCCGLPALVDGDIETALGFAQKNVEILAELDVDAIITDCTSC